jgi:hypothetical protein
LTRISFALPVAAGKEEDWRRVLQELEGSRFGEAERTGRRLGVYAVWVWLQRTQGGATAIVLVEAEDTARALSMLADSDEIFERWLKRRIEEFHGVDVSRARFGASLEIVFRSGSGTGSGTPPGGER